MNKKKVFVACLTIFFTLSFLFGGNLGKSDALKGGKKPKFTASPTLTPSATPTPTPTPTLSPSPTATPTPPVDSKKEVLGFTTYYYNGDKSSYNSMQSNYSSIDYIATASHTTDGYGNISGILPTDQITFANSNSIMPFVLIGNNFDGNIAKTLLESQTNRQTFIQNVKNLIIQNNYKGVNIDLEGIFYYNRSHYILLLQELYPILSSLDYKVTVSVPAKTYDSLTNSWNGAFDYAEIAKYSDKVILMTYDEHYPGGIAGPVASIGWVSKVIDYAISVIPKEKILLGVPAYGYDWQGTNTRAYSINGCYNLAYLNGASVKWDEVSKTPWFEYVDSSYQNHIVWFENAQSLKFKLDLVNQKGLSGIAIWRLGLENTDYWYEINQGIR